MTVRAGFSFPLTLSLEPQKEKKRRNNYFSRQKLVSAKFTLTRVHIGGEFSQVPSCAFFEAQASENKEEKTKTGLSGTQGGTDSGLVSLAEKRILCIISAPREVKKS